MSRWPAPERDAWWAPRYGVLPPSEVRSSLRRHPEWRLERERLVRELRFADFDEAFACFERVAADAEDFGRHPDISILDGNRVRIAVANPRRAGITLAEMRLVEKVDAALRRRLEPPALRPVARLAEHERARPADLAA